MNHITHVYNLTLQPLYNKIRNRSSTPKPCPFCEVTEDKGFNIIYQDDDVIAFYDKRPASKCHVLITHKLHILQSVNELQSDHIPLVQHMMDTGMRLLSDHDFLPDQMQLGFHVPPFTSVQHLHLHCIGLPMGWRGWMYEEGRRWYVSASAVMKKLKYGY